MKKRMFFGLTVISMMFTLVAWQYAVEEIVELEQTTEISEQELGE